MAGQRGVATHNQKITYFTVVGDVAVSAEQSVISKHGVVSIRGSGMNSGVLAKDIPVSDADPGRSTGELLILTSSADERVGIDLAFTSNLGVSDHRGMMQNGGTRPDADTGFYVGEGPYGHPILDVGPSLHNR